MTQLAHQSNTTLPESSPADTGASAVAATGTASILGTVSTWPSSAPSPESAEAGAAVGSPRGSPTRRRLPRPPSYKQHNANAMEAHPSAAAKWNTSTSPSRPPWAGHAVGWRHSPGTSATANSSTGISHIRHRSTHAPAPHLVDVGTRLDPRQAVRVPSRQLVNRSQPLAHHVLGVAGLQQKPLQIGR